LDGWDNVIHRPLMNVMLVCPTGDIFIGSVDTTGHKKTKEYIAGELRTYRLDLQVVGNWSKQRDSNLFRQCQYYARSVGRSYRHVSLFVQARLLCSHSRPSPRRLGKRGKMFKALIIRAKWVCIYI
jgi:hypothetical protein